MHGCGKETSQRIQRGFLFKLSSEYMWFLFNFKVGCYKGLEKNMIRLQRKRDEVLGRLFEEIKLNNDNNIDVEKMRPQIETQFSLRKFEPEFFSDDVIKSLTLVSYFTSLSLLLNVDFDFLFVLIFSWLFCEVKIYHCCSNVGCRVIFKTNINFVMN